MTVDEVKAQVELIRQSIAEADAAHVLEDALYVKLLESIRDGTCPAPAGCAEGEAGGHPRRRRTRLCALVRLEESLPSLHDP